MKKKQSRCPKWLQDQMLKDIRATRKTKVVHPDAAVIAAPKADDGLSDAERLVQFRQATKDVFRHLPYFWEEQVMDDGTIFIKVPAYSVREMLELLS